MTKNIFNLDHKEAENFFCRSEIYYDGDLPTYFNFTKMLCGIRDSYVKYYSNIDIYNAKECDELHYDIYTNKDGGYAWRKLQLLNPILYIDFVLYITQKDNWDYIKKRINKLRSSCEEKISCASLPVVESRGKKRIKAAQILEWWDGVEQNSLKNALEYSYAYTTDIADCYPSIYTQSISWALHNKIIIKKNDDKEILGNIIEKKLVNMQHGHTNGLPQGTIIMAVMAEILFAYIDRKLFYTLKIKQKNLDYKIIRYRDDYKIFVNSKKDGEFILDNLTQILLEYNLKLNASKTNFYDDIISASIKHDKYNAIQHENDLLACNIQKSLIRVHKFLRDNPCSKQMAKVLSTINDTIIDNYKSSKFMLIKDRCEAMIGICVQIAYKNPVLHSSFCQILSTLLSLLPDDDAIEIIKKLVNIFSSTQHPAIIMLFLQRIALPYGIEVKFNEKLCDAVTEKLENTNCEMNIWSFSWLNAPNDFTNIVNQQEFITMSTINKLPKIIKKSEVDIFAKSLY